MLAVTATGEEMWEAKGAEVALRFRMVRRA